MDDLYKIPLQILFNICDNLSLESDREKDGNSIDYRQILKQDLFVFAAYMMGFADGMKAECRDLLKTFYPLPLSDEEADGIVFSIHELYDSTGIDIPQILTVLIEKDNEDYQKLHMTDYTRSRTYLYIQTVILLGMQINQIIDTEHPRMLEQMEEYLDMSDLYAREHLLIPIQLPRFKPDKIFH